MSDRKVLFVASVVKKHINQFHIPYLKWLKEQGYEVHVCARNDFEPESACEIPYCDRFYDIPFTRSPFKPANFAAYRKLKQILDENHYTLIHCHTPVAAAITRLAAGKARKNGSILLYTAHGFHFFKGAPASSRLYYIIERMLAGKTDAIITINREDHAAANAFCRRCGCDSYLIHGIGVDTVRIRNTEVDAEQTRKQLGIPQDAFLLMSTVEINRNKNITTALQAMAAATTDKKLFYLICGSGDMQETCKQLAMRLGIADRVIFAGYRYDVFELLHIANVFVFPSCREGLGIAAIEAMAAGLPLIASDIRGVREYAINEKNSLLFPPDDVLGFAGAIDWLADHPEKCREMGQNAADSVYPFDIRNSVQAMSDIYHRYIPFDDAAPDTEKQLQEADRA